MKAAKGRTSTVQTKTTGPFFRKENTTGSIGSADAGSSFFQPATSGGQRVQAKLNIGQPNDRFEKEADSTADRVVEGLQNRKDPTTSGAGENTVRRKPSLPPIVNMKCDGCVPEMPEQKKEPEAPGNDKPLRKKPIFESNGESPHDGDTIQRKCSECEKAEKEKGEGNNVQRKCSECEKADSEKGSDGIQRKAAINLQRKDCDGESETADSGLESRLQASKGSGSPLPANTRNQMESGMGADFSGVRIHNDSNAAQMSKELNAQAFTHGNDVYFNSGKYDTASRQGQHLLAHELTHTVQQSGGGKEPAAKMLQQKTQAASNAKTKLAKATKAELEEQATETGAIEKSGGQIIFVIKELKTEKYQLPKKSVENFNARGGDHKIPKGEDRGTNQGSIWKGAVRNPAKEKLEELAKAGGKDDPKDGSIMRLKQLKAKKQYKGIAGTFTQLANEVLVPSWDFKGQSSIYQVEHMVDWQILGDECDKPENLILLEENKNRSVGDKVKKAILAAIAKIAKRYAGGFDDVPRDADQIKKKYDVKVDRINGGGSPLKDEEMYVSDALKDKAHDKNPYKDKNISITEEEIPKNHFLLTTSDKRASYIIPYSAKNTKIGAFKVTVTKNGDSIDSIELESIINGKTTELGVEESLKKKKVSVNKQKADKYIIQDSGETSAIAPVLKSLSLTKFSPIEIRDEDIAITGLDVSVHGKVKSTLSILQGVDISFSYENGDFNVKAVIPLESIGKNIPKPFKVDYCNIEIGGGTNTPMYIAGGLGFSIEKFGQGELFAKLDKSVTFEGKFNFEAKYFDPAEVCVSYEDGKWSMSGKLGLKKGLLKGIKKADLCVGYVNGSFFVSGDAELDVPGIDKVKLGAAVAENGDLSFYAEVQLKTMPGIKSGMVRVNISSKADGELKVSIKGEAVPDFPSIPELAPKLTVSWEDGVFDVSATATYKKGRFNGTLEVGVTNRQIDEKGKPGSTPDPENKLTIFGFGSLEVELFKNIKGSVSIRVTPLKEVLVAGAIKVDNLTPFGDGYNFDKELLKFPTITIPLLGIPGMSVSAIIDGSVHFKFNWQPLVLKELKVDFKETNINELEKIKLDITGTVGSSAHAEVYLEISAGIKAQVLIASLTGKLSGQAGLALDAEAGGALDAGWDMEKGLLFREIRAFLNVTPKALFRLVGSVSVDLDLWVTTINLYYHEWVLAEKQLDLRSLTLKLDFPIKFDDQGKVMTPDPDKMNLEKPKFDGDAGKEILNSAVNGDAEKELEEKKKALREKIRNDLRNSTDDKEFTPSTYRDKMMKKYEKSPELQQFVSATIEEESRILEYENFEKTKNMLRNSPISLQGKLTVLDFFAIFNRFITAPEVAGFRAELTILDEARKIKEAQDAAAAAGAPKTPESTAPPVPLPDPSKAPPPVNGGGGGTNDKPDTAGAAPAAAPAPTPAAEAPKEPGNGSNVQRKEEKIKEDPDKLKFSEELEEIPLDNEDVYRIQRKEEDDQPEEERADITPAPSNLVQLSPTDDLDKSFRKSLDEKDYAKAAEYLNGFSREDILERLRDKPAAITASIHVGAIQHPGVGPKSQVAELTNAAFIEINFKNEVLKKQWVDAARLLNGLNENDIKRTLVTMDVEGRVSLRTAGISNGFPAVVKMVDADPGFQAFEKARVAKLEDDYNTAIAKKDWPSAVKLLNGYNDDDVQMKLALLNMSAPDSVKYMRAAADNLEENGRLSKYAQAVISGSSTYLKDLLLAGPLVRDVWAMQFLKGMEFSGVSGRFGESWQKVKDNFSDPKNAGLFITGVQTGFLVGSISDLAENIYGIFKLAWDLLKLQAEAMFEPMKLYDEIARVVQALPDLILRIMNGEEIGYQVGMHVSKTLNKDFVQKPPYDQGKFAGEIAGRITMEIALLFIGVEEVSLIAKSVKATRWGAAVAEGLKASRVGKILMEAKGAGKVLQGVEELAIDAGKMEDALSKMARIEEKTPAIAEDMMKLEQKLMTERAATSADFVKPLTEAAYDAEIKTGQHTYKRNRLDQSWCRFSVEKCDLHLPEAVEAVADKKVPPEVRLAYSGQKATGRLSADTFAEVRRVRATQGFTSEAMKKNVAVAKVMTPEGKPIFLQSVNQGAGGAHSEEMIAAQLHELNTRWAATGKKGTVVELFTERAPCDGCRKVISSQFGSVDVYYLAGAGERNRWELLKNRWAQIDKALKALNK
ncbi:MAG: DUF4157 domain-containing protein [Chitinophagaceae bacterium]|nr:MAG: DUF4157 domain-containing protein [Chitinophagaceae bacterium]